MNKHFKFLHDVAAAAPPPTKPPVTQPPAPVTQPEPEQEAVEVPVHWVFYTLTALILVALIVLLVYLYIKYQQRQVYVEYSVNPESGIPKSHISFNQRRKFLNWKINQSKDPNEFVKISEGKNYYGQFYELKFVEKSGINNAVIANQPITKEVTSYYEIEIEDNPRNCDITIGFCSDKEYNKNLILGLSSTSVGFHSKTGQVWSQGKMFFDYGFKAVYGETIGIGIRQSDGRIWLSYNGKFLNPPPPSEYKDPEEKKKGDDDNDEEQNQKAIEDDLKAKKIIINRSGPLFLAISANGPCKVNLNIGACQFRMHQKELAHGLLH